MSIYITCPSCGNRTHVLDIDADRKSKCQLCGAKLRAPANCTLCEVDLSDTRCVLDKHGRPFCASCWQAKLDREPEKKTLPFSPTVFEDETFLDEFVLPETDPLSICTACRSPFRPEQQPGNHDALLCNSCAAMPQQPPFSRFMCGVTTLLCDLLKRVTQGFLPDSQFSWESLFGGILGVLLMGGFFFHALILGVAHLHFGLTGAIYLVGITLGAWILISAWRRSSQDGGKAWYLTRWAACPVSVFACVLAAWRGNLEGWVDLHLLNGPEAFPAVACWVVTMVNSRGDSRKRFMNPLQTLALTAVVVGWTILQGPQPRSRPRAMVETMAQPPTLPDTSDRRGAENPQTMERQHPRTQWRASVDGTTQSENLLSPYAVAKTPARQPAMPPPREQCRAFSTALERTLNQQDLSLIGTSVGLDVLAGRTTDGIAVNPATSRLAKDVVAERWQQLISKVEEAVRPRDGIRFLRLQDAAGETRALFRLLFKDGSFNYYAFVLTTGADGKVRIVDLYDYASGDLLSQGLRRMLGPQLVARQEGSLDGLRGFDRDLMINADLVGEFLRFAKTEKAMEAIAVYNRLPLTLQNEKSLHLLFLQAAGVVSDQALTNALEHYRKIFPDDPGLDLWLIELHQRQKNYGLLLETLDHMQKTVGGDAYLDAMKAEAYLAVDLDQAIALSTRAIRAEPKLGEPYWTLIQVSLVRKRFDETARMLTLLEKGLGVEIPDVRQMPAFADFIKSSEYGSWAIGRPNRSTRVGSARGEGRAAFPTSAPASESPAVSQVDALLEAVVPRPQGSESAKAKEKSRLPIGIMNNFTKSMKLDRNLSEREFWDRLNGYGGNAEFVSPAKQFIEIQFKMAAPQNSVNTKDVDQAQGLALAAERDRLVLESGYSPDTFQKLIVTYVAVHRELAARQVTAQAEAAKNEAERKALLEEYNNRNQTPIFRPNR